MGYQVQEEFNDEIIRKKAVINLEKCKTYEETQLKQGKKYVRVDKKTYVLR